MLWDASIFQMRKLDRAEAELRRALELEPKFAPALFSLALLQSQSNRLGEAEQAFRQLASFPDKNISRFTASSCFNKASQRLD